MPKTLVNDINIHYADEGSGEPLLLLHGLGSSVPDWEDQIPVFAQHFRVIAPALRGHGKTDKPKGPYSIGMMADDAFGLLDHLGIGTCHVLGFSMGGAIAFQMAVDQKKRVHSMVILNSQPSFVLDHWRKHLFVLARIMMARIVGMERMARLVAKKLFPGADQAHLRQKMIARHGKNDPDMYVAAVNALKGWSVQEWIGGLNMPMLILAAEKDYISLEDKQAYVAELPNARLEILEDSRHASHIDQTERFNKIVLEFLLAHPIGDEKAGFWQKLKTRMRLSDDEDGHQ